MKYVNVAFKVAVITITALCLVYSTIDFVRWTIKPNVYPDGKTVFYDSSGVTVGDQVYHDHLWWKVSRVAKNKTNGYNKCEITIDDNTTESRP